METIVAARPVSFHSFTLSLRTGGTRRFHDITDEVLERLTDWGVENGLLVVASRHTTAAIAINEHEPELLKDLDMFLHGMAPEEVPYAHNAVPCGPDEHPNGHAHCQALLLNSSVSIPVAGSRLLLGRYQRIFLVELDRERPRQVNIVFLGA